MKRLIFLFLLFCGTAATVQARENWLVVPMMMNLSSNTSVVTTAASVVVATTPVILDDVNINSAGTSSTLEIFNSKVSTTSFERKICNIDSTSKVSFHYGIYLSSGLAIYNRGSTPADVTISYRER